MDVKTVDEIFDEMLACFGEKTGMELDAGCDLAVRLYAAAAQVYALYVQADWVTRQAFPQTAEGDYLDLHAQLRSVERKSATYAVGTLRFTAGETSENDRTIPLGTVCMTAGLVRFETTQAAVLPAGETQVDVPAQALLAGSAGNVSANTIVSMAVAPVGIQSCSNPSPFLGGSDGETDDELRLRVMDTFLRLPNGTNTAFYEQGALSFDEVAAVSVLPRNRGVGTVDVVVATGSGQPSEELLAELEDYFQTRREIAVDVQVLAPEDVSLTLSIQVKAQDGWDGTQVRTGVKNTLQAWFSGERLGQDILLAQLGELIFHCEGVANYCIAVPAADVAIGADQLPVLTSISVEAMT